MTYPTNQYSSMQSWLQPYTRPATPSWLTGEPPQYTPIPVAPAPYGTGLANNGADWEQMPLGTNGLAPNEGMVPSSLVNAPIPAGPAGGAYEPTFWEGVVGYRRGDQAAGGWGGLALGGINTLMGAYAGLGQLDVAKQSLAQAKKEFSLNFANQAKTTNTRLEDRQRARVASNAGAYQSVGDYMDKNRINGVV